MTVETIQLLISLLAAGLLISGIYFMRYHQHALGLWLRRIGLLSLIASIAWWVLTTP